jgi:glycerophosphoryl diester phosphodiesterase
MMVLIAHRGNTDGKNVERENTVSYITEALKQGYHCEIDLFKFDGTHFYLGHDDAGDKVTPQWLGSNPLWCHAKNFETLQACVQLGIHCFFHQSDNYTITSQGWIWAYPGMPGGRYAIAVHPERLTEEELDRFGGLCSDHVNNYKHKL